MVLIKIEFYQVKILENKDFTLKYQKYKKLILYMNIADYLKKISLSLKELSRNKKSQIV